MLLDEFSNLHQAVTTAKELLDNEATKLNPQPSISSKTGERIAKDLTNVFGINAYRVTSLNTDDQIKLYISLVNQLVKQYQIVLDATMEHYLMLDGLYSSGDLDSMINEG